MTRFIVKRSIFNLAIYGCMFVAFSSCLSKDNKLSQVTNASDFELSPPRTATFIDKVIDSSDNGYNYAYAPSIIYQEGRFHMFYCSSPSGEGWDDIRYAWSSDGRNWSAPQVVLRLSNPTIERCVCDPSVVLFDGGDGPSYYL